MCNHHITRGTNLTRMQRAIKKKSLLQQSARAGVNSEKMQGGCEEKQLHVSSRTMNNLHQSRVQCCAHTVDHMSTGRKEGRKSRAFKINSCLLIILQSDAAVVSSQLTTTESFFSEMNPRCLPSREVVAPFSWAKMSRASSSTQPLLTTYLLLLHQPWRWL